MDEAKVISELDKNHTGLKKIIENYGLAAAGIGPPNLMESDLIDR